MEILQYLMEMLTYQELIWAQGYWNSLLSKSRNLGPTVFSYGDIKFGWIKIFLDMTFIVDGFPEPLNEGDNNALIMIFSTTALDFEIAFVLST